MVLNMQTWLLKVVEERYGGSFVIRAISSEVVSVFCFAISRLSERVETSQPAGARWPGAFRPPHRAKAAVSPWMTLRCTTYFSTVLFYASK